VEPGGFEPPTFPVSPGRAQQLFDKSAVLLPFNVILPLHHVASAWKLLEVPQFPRASIFDCLGVVRLMISNTLFQMFGLPNIESAGGFTLEDVNEIGHKITGGDYGNVLAFFFGGAGGIRTPDLLDAIEARSQLRHGPTGMEMIKNCSILATRGQTRNRRRIHLASKLPDARSRHWLASD
jgi:hypothetical protein